MKPKRLGDFAQAKYVERNENVPRGARVTRAKDQDENEMKNILCVI